MKSEEELGSIWKKEFREVKDMQYAMHELRVDLSVYIGFVRNIAKRSEKHFPHVAAGLIGIAFVMEQSCLQGLQDLIDAEPVHFRKGLFDRWYIFHPQNGTLAWSGSTWVPCTSQGVPVGGVQVCNFESEADAREYWRQRESESKNH